ncbi:FUSC family protein [Vibrio profundum]|uniref:FUSC family protein n=1 Tax=Vibrio profundum TaxID=2910247 RepID=UPI003D142C73
MTYVKQYLLSHQQFAHAIRVTAALAFAMAFDYLTQIPHSLWGPITVSVVMIQPHDGAIVHKGFQRIVGTLVGAALGLVTLLFPSQMPYLVPMWILLACFLLTLRMQGQYSYLFFLCVLTLLIVGYQDDSDTELAVALWRVTNILIGALIAMAFSRLFPIRATSAWKHLIGQMYTNLKTLYLAHCSSHLPSDYHLVELRKKVITDHLKMSNLTANIGKEQATCIELYTDYLRTQRTLIALVEQLVDTHWSSSLGHQQLLNNEELKHYQHCIGELFIQLDKGELDDVTIPEPLVLSDMGKKLAHSDDLDQANFKLGPYGYLWLTRQLLRNLDTLFEQKRQLDSLH